MQRNIITAERESNVLKLGWLPYSFPVLHVIPSSSRELLSHVIFINDMAYLCQKSRVILLFE